MIAVSESVAAAAAVLGDLAEHGVPLGPFTTYRLGGPAALLVRAASVEHVRLVAAARQVSGLPVLVVGRGSNMLVADSGFAGIAVLVTGLSSARSDGTGADIELDDDAGTFSAGAGVALPVAARRLSALGRRGFEWAVGVPGSVGGAVRMNAGGHGSDIASCLVDTDIVDLATGELATWAAADVGLRFRASDLTDEHVVVSARVRVRPGDRAESEAELAEIVRWRRENQPGGQNCGSVFVNPVPGEVSAGSLVDALGLRGLRHGTATVSEKHANFIQGSDGGSADDVRELIELVRAKVADGTGYLLRSEVRLVGFDDLTVGGDQAPAEEPGR